MFDKYFEWTKDVGKNIEPRDHAVLDYLTTSAFLLMAAAYWGRHKRATFVAMANGFFVLGLSLLTDYDGDGRRPISFPRHGEMDVLQAVLAAAMPTILGFGGSAAALPFRLQAGNELFVVSKTDYKARQRTAGQRAERVA